MGGSDQDLLVFADSEDDPLLLIQEVQGLPLEGDLDIHIFSPHLAPTLAFEILRDAEVLYEAEPGQGALSLAELAGIAEPPPPPFKDFLEVKRMGREETLRKLERKLVSLERRKAGLVARLGVMSQTDFLADELLQEFAFARLYKITQGVIDLAALLIALEGRVPPAEGPERLKVLGEMGLIPTELAHRLVGMARFRNVLAHVYDELDLVRLYRFATHEIQDIEAFIEAVKAYVASKL